MSKYETLSDTELLNLYDVVNDDYSSLNVAQSSIKILINACYGATSNPYFRWFDPKIAESITLTGQLTIRWAERTINEQLNKILKTDGYLYVKYIDTDSLYIELEKFVDAHCAGQSQSEIVDSIDNFVKTKVQPALDKGFKELQQYMNHKKAAIDMKRESIGDHAIWTGKKHYIMNELDKEGVRYAEPKIKMQGIEAVKSSTPAAARAIIKEGLVILLQKTEPEFHTFMKTSRDKFFSQPYDQVAFPRTCNNLAKYANTDSIFGKATPIHVRGALVFNDYIKRNKLDRELQAIEEGEKIKFCYLTMPNPLRSNAIATSGELPEQLTLQNYIDYDTQFNKAVVEPLRSIATAINWETEKTLNLEDLFIYD